MNRGERERMMKERGEWKDRCSSGKLGTKLWKEIIGKRKVMARNSLKGQVEVRSRRWEVRARKGKRK